MVISTFLYSFLISVFIFFLFLPGGLASRYLITRGMDTPSPAPGNSYLFNRHKLNKHKNNMEGNAI